MARQQRQHARRHGGHARGRRAGEGTRQLARGLGWFGIGLGLMQMAAPHRFTRALGLEGHERLVVGCGVREVATGIGILAARDPQPWVWGRLGGDALDLGGLAPALAGSKDRRRGAGLAFLAVVGVTLRDLACATMLRQRARRRAARHPDYSDRSGLPCPAAEMRGAARDFTVPPDFRIPEALRPWAA